MDMGCILKTFTPEEDEAGFYNQSYFDNGLSGRVCEYLTSGLVIVGERDLRMSRFISKRYGYWMDLEDFMQPDGPEKLRKMVIESKEKPRQTDSYSIKNNINRLRSFYQRTYSIVYDKI